MEMANRFLNEGFSGGEKKRNEILQLLLLNPELAMLDEIDSGLDVDAINVVAKAVKEYNGVYKSFNSNGTSKLREYRLFKMEVLDPLQSDMEGEFYYLLPNSLSGDLTKYDALLLSMAQRTKNSVLECNGKLTAYEYIFEEIFAPC